MEDARIERRQDDPAPCRIQVHAWEDGPSAHVLIVAQNELNARAWKVSHDAATGLWTGGCAAVGTEDAPHDLAPLARSMPTGPLTYDDLERLGMFSHDASLSETILGFADAEARPQALGSMLHMGFGTGKSSFVSQMAGRIHRMSERTAAPADFGYPTEQAARLPSPKAGFRIRTGSTSGPPGHVTGLPVGAPGTGRAEAAARISEALLAMRARHLPAASEILGRENWTAEAYAFLAHPGRRGERRRQAARLYPALANAMSKAAEVGEAIDAGRPFEDVLRKAIAPVRGTTPSRAALRRLRALPADQGFAGLNRALMLTDRIPHDWLPKSRDGWKLLLPRIPNLVQGCDRLGLRLADVVGRLGGDWTSLTGSISDATEAEGAGRPTLGSLDDAADMAERFRDTLVAPIMARMRSPEAPGAGDASGLRIAGGVLFGGKPLAGIHRLQSAWHEGVGAFEGRLPIEASGKSWPRAFAPFDAGDGIVVTCLTDERMLREEGGEGPDASGVRGLDHCVGGYGRRCYTGEAVVASIRQVGAGGVVRLSTVEFEPGTRGAGDGPLELVQHFGRANAPPPRRAQKALCDLLDAIATGRHRIDRAALDGLSPDGFDEGVDWNAPGILEGTFHAWAEFLPREVARGGLAALGERIGAVAAGLPPLPPGGHAVPPPAPRIVYVDGGNIAEMTRRLQERAWPIPPDDTVPEAPAPGF